MLRRAGVAVNHKRVYRIRREEGLCLPRKRPKKQKRGVFCKGIKRARYPNHIWAYDIAFDRLESGEQLKFLDVIDEFTRRRVALWPARSMDARAVIEVLERAFSKYGVPKYLRSDNGPEFIAAELSLWLKNRGTQTMHIAPGHPWENPFVESGIGKSRDEFLNEEVFRSVREAQILSEKWRRYYNEERLHSSLGYKTPMEFMRAWEKSHKKKISQ
jgi:putative transposase